MSSDNLVNACLVGECLQHIDGLDVCYDLNSDPHGEPQAYTVLRVPLEHKDQYITTLCDNMKFICAEGNFYSFLVISAHISNCLTSLLH